jgi:hypothetical protein
VHRQGQGQRALRVRRQGLHHFISYDLRTTYPKEATQKRGVLDVSSKRAARGSVPVTLDREYGFTQIHAPMKELKEDHHCLIERSKETDECGFYS